MSKETDDICIKLFGKKEKDVKWVMFTNYVHKQLLEGEDCLRTGLYSWIPVFNGEIKQFQEFDLKDCKNYDIIHVNLSGQDFHIPGCVKEALGENSKTKVVANNDYTVELWQASFDYIPTLKRELKYPDMIFGTEPYQVGALELLSGRKVYEIVHPCFVRRLKSLAKKPVRDVISVVWHRYDAYVMAPSLAVNNLGFETRLIGYDPIGDKKKYMTSCLYTHILQATNYMDFCDQLMESKVVVDPFTLTSQSRTGWDCAAMGIPMVGSNRNHSVRTCFPYTMCDPYDIKQIRALVKRILTDKEFREKVIKYAQEAVEEVSYKNSKRKYLEALGKGSPKIVEEELKMAEKTIGTYAPKGFNHKGVTGSEPEDRGKENGAKGITADVMNPSLPIEKIVHNPVTEKPAKVPISGANKTVE